jgi:hypothetical protein
VAQATTLQFAQTNSHIHTQCLATRQTSAGEELWACSDAVSGFVVGTSTDDGATFTTKLCSVTGMTLDTCPASSGTLGCAASGNTAAVCGSVYDQICLLDSDDFMCEPCGADGGVAGGDAGATAETGSSGGGSTGPGGAGSTGSSTKKSSSSCDFSPGESGGGAAGAIAGLAFTALAAARRRRREPGRR